MPTEAVLAEMRVAHPPVQYLVGTPKGRLTRLEKALLAKPWQDAPPGCKSSPCLRMPSFMSSRKAPTGSPRSGRSVRRQLKWLWARLKQLAGMKLTREEHANHRFLGG